MRSQGGPLLGFVCVGRQSSVAVTVRVNEHQFISRRAENPFSGVIFMEKNVGGMDRTVRLAVGIVLVVVALAGFAELITYEIGPITTMIGSAIVGVIGLILVVTGALRQCVLNQVLGINTYQN